MELVEVCKLIRIFTLIKKKKLLQKASTSLQFFKHQLIRT